MARINGTRFDNDIEGTCYRDIIYGFAGDDFLWGYEGNDSLYGGAGDDELDGGTGSDYLEGGTGSDLFVVDSTGDRVVEMANEGDFDVVYSYLGRYTLGANVEDLVAVGSGNFFGTGNALDNYIHGYFGNDTLDGAGGADTLFGEHGNDTYYLDQRGDLAVERAGEGYDYVFTDVATHRLGANIEELIYDGEGNFTGYGNAGHNFIGGGVGNDRLFGLDGDDELDGGLGADLLVGGNGHDRLIGDEGGDRLYGGRGRDILDGGSGPDRFYFDTPLGSENVDRILDFGDGSDRIMLDRAVFDGLDAGTLDPDAFHEGTVSTHDTDRILYDEDTGRIFYDEDGAGGASAVLFARVEPGTNLSNADFFAYG